MRCFNCGSENCTVVNEVTTTEKGYSVTKGCCGFLLFSWWGLLCGLCGSGRTTNSRNFWLCHNCGSKFKA